MDQTLIATTVRITKQTQKCEIKYKVAQMKQNILINLAIF